MAASGPIVERWLARTVESYPSLTAHFLSAEEDPFRNPVGHALRQGLAALAGELFGSMDAGQIASALDKIVRIRAVQDMDPSQAVGFVFLLRPVLRELAAEEDLELLDRRIDQLALMAFDKYMSCREQLSAIRVNEAKRAIRDVVGLSPRRAR